MEYIRTQEYNTRIDVFFDGEKYVFVNAFHGCVAIATRTKITEFPEDKVVAFFFAEKTRETISSTTIRRVIGKSESRYVPTIVNYQWEEVDATSLPVFVSVQINRR